jgi:hypothetical protein
MLYSEIIAVCSQIHTKTYKYTVWAEHSIYLNGTRGSARGHPGC